MTFTVMARCADTGKLGIATATRSLAVGARVPHILPNRGAVAIMAIADRRLGDTALRLLEQGYRGQGVIDALVSADRIMSTGSLASSTPMATPRRARASIIATGRATVSASTALCSATC